ncbi:potassium transporter KefB [Flavobacterium pallidum]|uniref:Potassium transporter KefB n=2 Tax=Flavobacterium pallidum TaxID=2172098 RepID=A0A2S1SLJ0_9FLAO|nr:potassium transporter KefB [Flavobacterium pallidum]
MAVGALIGLALISLFLLGAETQPGFPDYWRARPLIVVPFAGAVGGAFYYFMARWFHSGTPRIIATIVSALVFLIFLWLGSVLGLAGTYWH